MLIQAPDRPGIGALHRKNLIGARVVQRRALIEGEDDICANLVLDLHRDLWRKSMHRAIYVRFEGDALIIYMGQALFILCDHIIISESIRIHSQYFFESNT